jgi:hypothetical protein
MCKLTSTSNGSRAAKSSFSKRGFRESVFNAVILKQGPLQKRTHGLLKRNQTRYFTLQGHYLKYYSDVSKLQSDLKGTIDLRHDTVEPHCRRGKGAEELEIVLNGGVARLKATSKDEAQDWIDVILEVVLAQKDGSQDTLRDTFGARHHESEECVYGIGIDEKTSNVGILKSMRAVSMLSGFAQAVGTQVRLHKGDPSAPPPATNETKTGAAVTENESDSTHTIDSETATTTTSESVTNDRVDPGWEKGQHVLYTNSQGGRQKAVVVTVHLDDVDPYCNIFLPITNCERQAALVTLKAIPAPPPARHIQQQPTPTPTSPAPGPVPAPPPAPATCGEPGL